MKKEMHISAKNGGLRDIDYVYCGGVTNIIKSRISLPDCDKIIKRYDQTLDTSPDIKSTKNLIGAEKSEWDIHNNQVCYHENKIIIDKINNMMKYMVKSTDDYAIIMDDMWYAKYTNDSFIAPHGHGNNLGYWSFCVYLNCEPDGTILYYTSGLDNTIPVKFYKGDIALFPANLGHWTNDVYKGRKIVAGNYLLSIVRKEKTEETKK